MFKYFSKKHYILFFIIVHVAILAYDNPLFSAEYYTVPENENPHNCRLWGMISENCPDGLIFNQLVTAPSSLKSLTGYFNGDGWGINYYQNQGDSAIITRSSNKAFNDPEFDSTSLRVDSIAPFLAMAHVRNCTAGCCCHNCETIADPHPFTRFMTGKYWTFAHNGDIEKSVLIELIGESYLLDNPPTGSGIPECDPSDTSLVVDSELYFLLLLKNIELSNWQITEGIINALVELITHEPTASLNFILSDGQNLWAFKRGETLHYINNLENSYITVASVISDQNQPDWVSFDEFALIKAGSDNNFEEYDIESMLPANFYVIGDANKSYNFNGLDITYSVSYLKGLGPPPPDSISCGTHGMIYAAADANGSCSFNGIDVTYGVNYLKGYGASPSACPDCPPEL